jgi:hypothetical protein
LDTVVEKHRLSSPLQELSTSDLENSAEIRQRYGLSEDKVRQDEEGDMCKDEADAIWRAIEQLSKGFMDDLVNGVCSSVEEDYPLLKPFLTLLEFSFIHRLEQKRTMNDIWGAFLNNKRFMEAAARKTASPELTSSIKAGLDNVKGFTLLRTGFAKVRAWLRLSLMSKSLALALETLMSIKDFRYSYCCHLSAEKKVVHGGFIRDTARTRLCAATACD